MKKGNGSHCGVNQDLIDINNMESMESPSSEINPFISEVLDNIADIFVMPPGLPPHQNHEHASNLKFGTEPINV